MGIRIALIHIHFLVRKGLKSLISSNDEFVLAGEYDPALRLEGRGVIELIVDVIN